MLKLCLPLIKVMAKRWEYKLMTHLSEFEQYQKGETLATEFFQRKIDELFLKGGGRFFVPKGKYVLSTVFLKSSVEIFFEEGVELVGSLKFSDYQPDEKVDYPLYQDASHSFFHCSMFVGIDCENVKIIGKAKIDMRSVWDEENVRNMAHRGAKTIALKNCKNVAISGLEIHNATDLAIYFAGCENVDIYDIKMRVYIDGISPDNSKNVRIHDCDIETGDDGIVFKSSYTLNRLDVCKDIHVWDCKVKSRCNAIKFGTETNGGFENILIENVEIYETRITGISIESVDGAVIDGVTIRNVQMRNVNAPLFVHVGKRMRGPQGLAVGKIKNVSLENITATGPYEPYEAIARNYSTYKSNDFYQYPWIFGNATKLKTDEDFIKKSDWQMTCNVCGLKESPLENVTLKNVRLELDGGVEEYTRKVPEDAQDYPEVYVYGRILPAKGIYFRHIKGLTLDNVTVETYRPDAREVFIFENVN